MLQLSVLVLLIFTQNGPQDTSVAIDTRFVPVQRLELLRERCGPGVEACTRFFGARLDAVCKAAGSEWQVTATAHMTGLIYLPKSVLLKHELMHIEDMKRAVSSHVTDLQSQRYKSEDSCRDAAAEATSGFDEAARQMAKASNAVRH